MANITVRRSFVGDLLIRLPIEEIKWYADNAEDATVKEIATEIISWIEEDLA